jgi:methionine synthase / methylenetetrahydrofolate reductase(NADPH)
LKRKATKKNKAELLRERLTELKMPLIADGGMATSLYENGFYINRSFEELSVTEPQAVSRVVKGFLEAGAQLFHTNTFSATRPKLTQYGLQDELPKILRKAAEISLKVAGSENFVLGLLGPLGVLLEPLGPTSRKEAEAMFSEAARELDRAGVHGFAINAIHDFNELRCAIRAVKKISKKPLFVNIGLNESLKTSFGHSLSEFAELTHAENIDVIGICGEIGPSPMLTAIENLRPLTTKPIMVLPNAGLPRYVNDQYIYLCNPDYIGKFARRFVQAGAFIVGGHSGVYASHIKAIANSIRMTRHHDVAPKKITKKIRPIIDQGQDPKPLKNRSLLGHALASGEKVVTVELVPPTLSDFSKFEERCHELVAGGVKFVNIPDGARAMARISSMQLATYVKNKFNLEPVPHITCRDRNLIGLQSELLGAHIGGIRNLLLVTGDPPKLGNNPGATAVYDVDSIGLTHIVSRLNKGLDIGGAATKSATEFTTGVALNPTARNAKLEISRFRYKIEAGCDFAITQPIYNLETYKTFMDQVGDTKVPIIMGVWPLVSLRNAEFLKYEVPGVDVPDKIIDEMKKAGDSKEDALKRGIDIAVQIMLEAKDFVAGFQVSAPFNRADVALEVIRSVF